MVRSDLISEYEEQDQDRGDSDDIYWLRVEHQICAGGLSALPGEFEGGNRSSNRLPAGGGCD